jgi:hypothetical protein
MEKPTDFKDRTYVVLTKLSKAFGFQALSEKPAADLRSPDWEMPRSGGSVTDVYPR